MTTADVVVIGLMGLAALSAAVTFAVITKTLFDHGLVDRNASAPDLRHFYSTYRTHTRRISGRVGRVFWMHCLSAGLFIAIGVIYTVWRCILPFVR